MKYFLLLFMLMVLLQQNNRHNPARKSLIKGKWANIDLGHCKYDDYKDLLFTDSIVILNARISAVFFDKYLIDGDTLVLIDSASNDTTFSRILKLTEDTLVLSSIRNQQFEHTYNKENNL